MTEVRFFGNSKQICGFRVSGHSGYGFEGTDIVCAAVTSAVRLAECIISDTLHCHPEIEIKEADIKLMLDSGEAVIAADVLKGLYLYMKELSTEYPDNIKLIGG